jgi:hypothetical protein
MVPLQFSCDYRYNPTKVDDDEEIQKTSGSIVSVFWRVDCSVFRNGGLVVG